MSSKKCSQKRSNNIKLSNMLERYAHIIKVNFFVFVWKFFIAYGFDLRFANDAQYALKPNQQIITNPFLQ